MSTAAAPSRRPPLVPLWAQLAVALVLGALVGHALGPRAAVLGEGALLFVKLLKLLATPLVFLSIVDALLATGVPLRRALVLVPISIVNAVVAALISLSLLHAAPLGRFVDVARLRALVTTAPAPPPLLAGVSHALDHLLIDNILWVVAAALVAGAAFRIGPAARAPVTARVARAAHGALALVLRVLAVVVALVPLAMFGVMARVVGTSGLAIFPALGLFVLVVTGAIALHVFGWYALVVRFGAGRAPGRFYRDGGDALATAMAAGSSLATLPVTLRTLEERMGVSPESARLAAVVGSNLNHDGIVLYEAAAALFVAQLYAVDTTLWQQLKVIGLSIAAAVGIAGIPEAGMITLALVLGGVGLPVAAAPLLLPVDWFLGRLRATANVANDLAVAALLDRLAGRRRAASATSAARG